MAARPKRRRIGLWLLVAAVIAFGINTIVVDRATRPARARDGGRVIDTGVVQANVRVQGDGPAVVLIHGFSAAIDWWDAIAPALAADHRVISIDLIGHGGTAAPASGYSIERQATLVGAVLDTLGVDRVAVIGHSMGGEVAAAFVESHPDRITALILIDSPPNAAADFELLTRLYLTPGVGEFLSRLRSNAAIRYGLAQAFAPGFTVPDSFVDDVWQLTFTAFRSAHDESLVYRAAKPTNERLASVRPVPPLLVIFGSRDAIVPPENARLFERVPGAKIVMLEGVGHSPIVEAPQKTLALIEPFLSGRP